MARRLVLLGAVVAAAVAASPRAEALQISTASKGSVSSKDGVAWYFGYSQTMPVGLVFDPNTGGAYSFAPVDVSQSQANDAGLANTIEFDLLSNVASTDLTSGQSLAIAVTTAVSEGSTAHPVPIASVGGSACGNGGDCRRTQVGINDTAGAQTWYYAVPYTTNSTIRIGLYVRDLCTSFFVQSGSDAQGCADDAISASNYRTAIVAGAQAMRLTFQVVVINTNAANSDFVTYPIASPKDSAVLSLHFEDQNRTALSCGSGLSYFPGDQEIFLDLSQFSDAEQATPTGYSPIQTAIVVGKKANGTLDLASTFETGNDLVARVLLGNEERVGGFTNLASGGDLAHTYQVGVLAADAAGLISVPNNGLLANGCALQNVQTSTIQGFLSKGNCFIATAAYRDYDAPPVEMLRQFRDRVLLKTGLGTRFVHWYYGWSPRAAEWLLAHPQFRSPVLRALIPLELVAWLVTPSGEPSR